MDLELATYRVTHGLKHLDDWNNGLGVYAISSISVDGIGK